MEGAIMFVRKGKTAILCILKPKRSVGNQINEKNSVFCLGNTRNVINYLTDVLVS